jgi:hypothetical protein
VEIIRDFLPVELTPIRRARALIGGDEIERGGRGCCRIDQRKAADKCGHGRTSGYAPELAHEMGQGDLSLSELILIERVERANAPSVRPIRKEM